MKDINEEKKVEKEIADENLYITYKMVKKKFPHKLKLYFIRNLTNTDDKVVVYDKGDIRIVSDEEEKAFLKAEYFPPLSFARQYKDLMEYAEKLRYDFRTKHKLKTGILKNYLQNLIVTKRSLRVLHKFAGAVTPLANKLELKKYKEELVNERLYTILHEFGHTEDSEVVVSGDELLERCGLGEVAYPINDVFLFEEGKYLIDYSFKPNRDMYYGLDDVLNEEQTHDLVTENNFAMTSTYNSIGTLIEYVVGKSTCYRAREQHNINMIRNKFLNVINDTGLFDEFVDKLDGIFDGRNGKERSYCEVRCYEILSKYIKAKTDKEVKSGKFDIEKYKEICEWRVPFELRGMNKTLDLMVDLNDYMEAKYTEMTGKEYKGKNQENVSENIEK